MKKPVTGYCLSLSLNYSKYVSYLNIYKFGIIADPELSEYKLFCRIWVCTENCFRESLRKSLKIWGHPDIPTPYALLLFIPLPVIPIPDIPKIKIGISIMFAVFLPNIPIPDIYTGF